MQNTFYQTKEEKIKTGQLLTAGLIFLSVFAVFRFGAIGLLIASAGIIGLLAVPFLYNKSNFFLLFSLLVYPLTRIFSTDDKFIITGALYLLALPGALTLMRKYFSRCSQTYYYLWGLVLYLAVIALNFFRPQVEMVELVKDFGRTFYSIFTILAVHNFVSNRPEKIDKLCKYISYLMNFMAVLSVGQFVTKIGGISIEGYYRVRGAFTNPNDYGYILSIFIAFAFCMFLNSEKNKDKTYWFATLALNLIILLVTFSKTSIINTSMALGVMAFFLPTRTKIRLFAGVAVMGLFLLILGSSMGLLDSLSARFSDTRSLIWRQEMWRNLYTLYWQGNIFFGQGPNATRDFFQYIMPVNSSVAPHNVHLEQLYNFGIAGIIPFVSIFILLLSKGFLIFKEKMANGIQNKIIGISIISIVLIAMVQNSMGNAFYDRAGNTIFWSIITLLVCSYRHYKYKDKDAS